MINLLALIIQSLEDAIKVMLVKSILGLTLVYTGSPISKLPVLEPTGM